jgi:23S rRNA (cytidine2498-2'-O)-methyltransferase
MHANAAQFVFLTCRPGAEGALKREVARREPAWRLAFSRPGFLTFKNGGDHPLSVQSLAEHPWTFAHAHGISLGRITGMQLSELTQQFWQQPDVTVLAASSTKGLSQNRRGEGDSPIFPRGLEKTGKVPDDFGIGPKLADIHVWQGRESARVDERPSDEAAAFATPLALEVDRALRAAAPESAAKLRAREGVSPLFRRAEKGDRPRRPSPRGALVLDVFLLEPGEWWIGYHCAVTPAERWPGGQIPIAMPAHAVSRAYAKIEEAIHWSGLPVAAGDECVEIGCAPGGASQALLDRGLFVTGIDPADVDEALVAHPRFRHLKKRGKDVRRREFVGVRWLVADMNIAPQATLDEVEPIVTHPGVSIRGLVLTLKPSDWAAAERLEEFAQRVRGWGYRDVRMRQLMTGGQEVCLVALRRKALRRLGKKLSRKRKQGGSEVASARPSSPRSATKRRSDPPHTGLPGPHF